MNAPTVTEVRKLSQQHAYTALQFHESIARDAGFSGTDHKYLGFFLQRGSMTAGELAQLSGLTTGAVTGLIDRFERKRLVKRQSDKEDRRKVIIVPNRAKISGLLAPYYADYQKQIETLLAGFSGRELTAIADFLDKSIRYMNENRDQLDGK